MDKVITKGVRGNIIKGEWQKLKGKAELSANYYATSKDILLLSKLMGDLGYAGTRAYIKTYGGKAHIVLKGYPGLRKIFTGTKYGLQNAKVVQLGLGKYGAVNAAKGGGVLTIILLSVYRVVDYFLTDTATLNQLIGTLATDVVKVGIATGASIAAASIAASTGFILALGPLAAIIVVGFGVSMLLEYADDRYHLTDKVIAALDEIEEKGIQKIIEEKKQTVIQNGKDIISNTVESVIDYAVESAQQSLINVINGLLRRSLIPRI